MNPVDQVEQIVLLSLDGPNFRNENSAFRDEVASRFHFEENVVPDGLGDILAGLVPKIVIGANVDATSLFFFPVGNGKAAACGNHPDVGT